MTGPITPHLKALPHADGVEVCFKERSLVIPPDMAREFGQQLIDAADAHDPLGVTPLPVVTPKGDPL